MNDDILNESHLHAEDYFNQNKVNPQSAAKVLWDIWHNIGYTHIDLSNCQFVCKEFFDAFYDLAREQDRLKQAFGIRWFTPHPTDRTFHDQVFEWIQQHVNKYGDQDSIMAYRKYSLIGEHYANPYKSKPIEAANKLFEIWQRRLSTEIDLWGCGFCDKEFFDTFLDLAREKGLLQEALKIWWLVHNAPCFENEPCFHDYVIQWVKDYAKEHGLESHTEWLKDYGLERFKDIPRINLFN